MKTKLLILILLSVIFIQCAGLLPQRYPIRYANNADYDICYIAIDGFRGTQSYPDTTILFNKEKLIPIRKGYYYVSSRYEPIETIIRNTPNDTISVFFFNIDTLQTYSWGIIQQEYKIAIRYDLSIQDIDVLRDESGFPYIPYPPTEAMRNIKMYPPYGSE